MGQPYSKWTIEEVGALLRMKADGMTNKAISIRLGRSHCAVTAQVTLRKCQRRPVEKRVFCVIVDKADLPVWYSLGWRVTEFSGERCNLVWPETCEPRRPRQFVELEAA